MNQFPYPNPKWTRLTSHFTMNIESYHVEGIFILDSPGFNIVCGDMTQRPKYGDTQSWRLCGYHVAIIDGHLLDPSISIICRCMAIRKIINSIFPFNSIRAVDWCMLKGVFKIYLISAKKEQFHILQKN
jgi:hypothetical protein